MRFMIQDSPVRSQLKRPFKPREEDFMKKIELCFVAVTLGSTSDNAAFQN